jgi:hypothetical protein
MMIYQNLTKNVWSKSDQTNYQKIKHLSLEVIEQAISLAMQRSVSRPNSLAYFVKEILTLSNPSQESKSQKKKKLQKIVSRIRELNVGKSGYLISDLVEDVKRACLRENVSFDNDLFNEIIGFNK